MKYPFLVLLLFLFAVPGAFGQAEKQDTIWVGAPAKGKTIHNNVGRRTKASAKWADGYIVYRNDTIHGLIMLYKFELWFQVPINDDYSYFFTYSLKDPSLRTIMMYNNADKKPLCFTRLKDNDKRLMRVLHEGKLNIYDDRIGYIYKPQDIDKNLIVVEYEGVIDDLSSFFTESTKRDLIGYINDAYGIKLIPKDISWEQLLVKIDQLD